METAITEAFAKSVQEAVNRCMETVKEESRKFAAALTAVRHLPTASPVTGGGLEHRLTALELAYERQVQKSIAGLSDDIGDLDGRLAALEKDKAPEEDTTPWPFGFQQHAWPGPSKKNEVVIDDKSTVLDFGSDFVVNVRHVEDEDVDDMPGLVPVEKTPAPATVLTPAPAPASVAPIPPVASVVPIPPVTVSKAPEAEAEAEEEEEGDPLELEEFEHEGETYYRDQDLNVYKPNEDGEVDAEAPIGRWLANRKTIKLWS